MTLTKLAKDGCTNYCGMYDESKVILWQKIESPTPGIIYKDDPSTQRLTPVVYYPGKEESGPTIDCISPGDVLIYLGEVVGMKNHGVFAAPDGRVVWGHHIYNFRIIPQSEL